ncbi:MAG: hypothetical protein AAF993_20640 [Pseudomonadota bacterium]
MDKLNRWLTLFANIGIVAGLVLVAIQLQQAALFADAEQANAEFGFAFGAQDLSLADALPEAWARARINAPDLTEVEVSLVDSFLTRVAANQILEEVQAARGVGFVNSSDEARSFVEFYLGNETALRWWHSRRQQFMLFLPAFAEAVDARIAEIGPELRTMQQRRVQEIANGPLPESVR